MMNEGMTSKVRKCPQCITDFSGKQIESINQFGSIPYYYLEKLLDHE